MSSDMCMVSADFGVNVQFGNNGRKEKYILQEKS